MEAGIRPGSCSPTSSHTSSTASRRGILKNTVGVAGEAGRRAAVDLSGRHLERLPTSLFSSLHLTSINLSHNLLKSVPSIALKRRQTGRNRRWRDRRRRQGPTDCREPPGPTAPQGKHKQGAGSSKQTGEDDGLSGDSGLPFDPVEEDSHRSDPDGESQSVVGASQCSIQQQQQQQQLGPRGAPHTTPRWGSLAEKLQAAKLRLRRPIKEYKLEETTTDICCAVPAVPPKVPPALHSEVHPSSGVRERQRVRREGGDLGSYEDSSSSGVDETDSDSESEREAGRGAAEGTTRGTARTLGALHHLRHFQQLQVVVLARNRLQEFPRCLLGLPRLACLSLTHNLLTSLPRALATSRLVDLDVTYNRVGGGVCPPPTLTHLRAAHNRITTTPTIPPMAALASLDLSGNRLRGVGGLGDARRGGQKGGEEVDTHPLTLNLRLNDLTGPVTLASIQNVTELDVSDNGITSLDVSCLAALTSLTCSNNALTSVTLHAAALTALTANNNRLANLEVRHHPRRLTKLNLAKNELLGVPAWLVSSTEVTLVDVSNNQVATLPAFLTSGHLRRLHTLSAHHNHLAAFPVPQRPVPAPHRTPRSPHSPAPYPDTLHEEPRLCSLEVLLLHNNRLTALPSTLFTWLNRLRVLNVSSNQLSIIPGLTEGRSGGRGATHTPESPKVTLSLQELYAAANHLRDLTPLQHCRALRILHAPYNHITSLHDRLVWSWELLEELVLSGNRLACVPAGVSRLRRLRVLRVHSNPLTSLPRLAHLSALKVVDASHCQLGRVELEELVSPGLLALDISGNTALSLDHHQFTKCRSRRPVNVVDVTSRSGRSLPLTRPQHNQQERHKHKAAGDTTKNTASSLPWSLGFAEVIGRDSKLTVGQLRVPDVGGVGSAGVAAVADGGKEMGSVGSLLSALPALLQEELTCSHTHTYALKYALLTALRQLRSKGASLPTAVCAAHLDAGHGGQWPVLRLCCYGPVSATVTTTHDTPIVLTTTALNTPPSAASECSEGLKCALAEAPTLPDPHTTELHLGPQHTAVIIGSASLWEVIGLKEAANICNEIKVPGTAAKHLLDLAQAYGARQAVSVIVVQLNPPLRPAHPHPPPVYSEVNKQQGVVKLAGKQHSGGRGSDKHYSERVTREEEEEEVTSCRRVKFDRNIATDISNKTRNFSERSQDTHIYGENSNIKVMKNNFPQRSQSTPNVHDLDRSSPSGQSQSDYSEHCLTYKKHIRTKAWDQSIINTSKEKSWQSIEDLYSYPIKKKEPEKKSRVEPQTISNGKSSGKKTVTYYHYPRPDPSMLPPNQHYGNHLLTMGQGQVQAGGVLAPPAGFGDPGSDSEGSDSGLSGVSGGQAHGDPQHQASSSTDSSTSNGQEQVTEEQFRSWEYLLARNAKLLFMRELDTLKKPNSRSTIMPTVSTPDLVLAAATEAEPAAHFQRNVVRKSRLGRGTFRLIQTKLSATTSKFNTLQKLKRSTSKGSNFRRFGSLQNLKYYQENRPRPPHYPLVQPDLASEMQERDALDSLELETRMHHYWHTGVTNF